jgi:hypothetical protein
VSSATSALARAAASSALSLSSSRAFICCQTTQGQVGQGVRRCPCARFTTLYCQYSQPQSAVLSSQLCQHCQWNLPACPHCPPCPASLHWTRLPGAPPRPLPLGAAGMCM